ncbi:MAG TPA: beta/gamma crystallin-related protein [Clostridia bacterium]
MIKNKIKKLLTSVSLAFVMICSSIAVMPATPVSALADGVYLYQDASYGGDWIRINQYNEAFNSREVYLGHATASAISDNFNDRISSIKIVGNYQVTLYDNWNCYGKACLFNGSNKNIGNYGMNDIVSSALVEPLDTVGMYVYTGRDCTGRCYRLDYGKYGELNSIDFDNQISSIKYIGNASHLSGSIELYNDTYYGHFIKTVPFSLSLFGPWSQYVNLISSDDITSSVNCYWTM